MEFLKDIWAGLPTILASVAIVAIVGLITVAIIDYLGPGAFLGFVLVLFIVGASYIVGYEKRTRK